MRFCCIKIQYIHQHLKRGRSIDGVRKNDGCKSYGKGSEAEGITTVFGYPGAAICPFYDELISSDIRHVLVRHEVNGGHAASGYARMTGKPAVAIATSGPGATNLITAIATAHMDSIPRCLSQDR